MGRKPRETGSEPLEETPIEGRRPPIPTGWISLDAALKGGIPFGVLTVIGGKPDVGKTNLCTHIAANAIKAGYRVAYFDTEGRIAANMDRLYLRGITPEDINTKIKVVSGLHTVEGVTGIIRGFLATKGMPTEIESGIVKFGMPDLIIIDSIASLTTLRALKSKHEENTSVGMGDLARTIQEEFKDILTYYVPRKEIAMVMVTQKRSMIAPIPKERLYLTNFLEHNAAVVVSLWGTEEEDESGTLRKPAQSSSLKIVPFKKVFFKFNKNHIGFPTAEGGGRYFLIDLPKIGVRRGDFDPIFEIIAYGGGRFHGLGFLRKRGDEYKTPSGITFTLKSVYYDIELRKKVIDECVPLLYDMLTKFYNGEWMLLEGVDEEEGDAL